MVMHIVDRYDGITPTTSLFPQHHAQQEALGCHLQSQRRWRAFAPTTAKLEKSHREIEAGTDQFGWLGAGSILKRCGARTSRRLWIM